MSSPFVTGGGGAQFETRVLAYYLASVLTEGAARALPGLHASEATAQRTDLGEPLDDVIVSGLANDGKTTKLALQVKNTLRFTASDDQWVATLGQAWQSFDDNDFDEARHRLGVAVGTYNTRADRYYQSALTWAEHSPSAEDFFARITLKDFAHKDQRDFVDTIREILMEQADETVDDERLWRFLRVFRILHFDFQNEESSRDVENAVERIRSALPPDERHQANAIWDHLITRAGESGPTAGGDSRATLLASLNAKSLPQLSGGTLWQDLQKIDRESQRALAAIRPDIQGLRLRRNGPYDKILEEIENGRFIQIDGEPGSGKSALLRQVVEEYRQIGGVFLLKDSRIASGGWAAHASRLGVSDNLVDLLAEFGGACAPVLFIDGIDKISEPGVRVTVNDIVCTIATEPSLSEWKILVTVREQNLDHVATWLDPSALDALSIRSVTVPSLGRSELNIVADRFPRLRPLILDGQHADVILQRPFFLDTIIRLSGQSGAETLPASEAELLALWWQLGGSDEMGTASAQDRRNALIDLAELFLRSPTAPIPIKDVSPIALESLKAAGVLRDVSLGHTVTFAHDIYEEWALCEWLMGRLPDVAEALRSVAEPQELVRPLQLLGSYELEFYESDEQWRALFANCDDAELRPIWQRTLLVSCLRTTRSTQVLEKLENFLAADEYAVLTKLLKALQTLEVVPNPIFFDEKRLPDLSSEERAKFAQHAALPKAFTWVRFLDWFFQSYPEPDPALIPNLLPVFKTWQSIGNWGSVRHCKEIGQLTFRWITEFEEARHPDRFADRRNPFDLKFRYEKEGKLEDSIRTVFLSSAGHVPDEVAAYLASKASGPRPHMYRDKILSEGNGLSAHLPRQLVDFVIAAFFEHPKDDDSPYGRSPSMERDLGISDMQSFYPASPYQTPFLALLRNDKAEGLRLIRSVCNHSIDVWRWQQERTDHYQKGVTPLPLELELPWGKQQFWGDGQVYGWFRGGWGNNASKSALMALEWWAFERLEAGEDFDTVIQDVIEGHDSVAALGIAVSLSIAHMADAMEYLLRFVTCPHLWRWDLDRSVSDQMGSHANELADWTQYRHLLMPVKQLNQREHRRVCLRDVVPYFVFGEDRELAERYTQAVRSMPERLPIIYEEEKADGDHLAVLRKDVNWMVEQADPQHWHTEEMEDGRVKFWNEPPSANAPERVEILKGHAQNERYLRLSLWARKCLEEGKLVEDVGLREAFEEAQGLDSDKVFDLPAKDYQAVSQAAGIAGVAYCLAKFADPDIWTDQMEAWVVNTIARSAHCVEKDDLTYRGSMLSMHPLIFAVHATAAMVKRGVDTSEFQRRLLYLALHPLESVAAEVAKAANDLAASHPQLQWELFAVFVRRCIVPEDERPNYHSLDKGDAEAAFHEELAAGAIKALNEGKGSALPRIPLPWTLKEGVTDLESKKPEDYDHSKVLFQTHIAQKTFLEFDIASLSRVGCQRAQILELIDQLIVMTLQEMVPPFADSRREYEGRTPYEWIFSFFHWAGAACRILSQSEIERIVMSPIMEGDNESALMAMQSVARSYLAHCVLPPGELTDERFAVWEMITDWIIENPEGQHLRHVDREFASCVYLSLFCFTRDFQPSFCGLDEGWEDLGRFVPILERVIGKFGGNKSLYHGVSQFFLRGGLDLMPEPGLTWLHRIANERTADQEFWSLNGDDTVEVLKKVLGVKAQQLDANHRKTVALIIDILVDNGVRGAAFLQQEQHRDNNARQY